MVSGTEPLGYRATSQSNKPYPVIRALAVADCLFPITRGTYMDEQDSNINTNIAGTPSVPAIQAPQPEAALEQASSCGGSSQVERKSVTPLSEREEADLLNSPDVGPSSLEDATEQLSKLKMKRRNPTTSERRQALKAKLAAKGIEWDPKKFKKGKRKPKQKTAKSVEEQRPIDGSQKRPRGDSSTPSSAEAQRKKPKNVPSPAKLDLAVKKGAYREALSSTKMAIVPLAYPEVKLTVEQRGIIEDGLMSKFELLEDGSYPVFSGTYMDGGALIVSCSNEVTSRWLESIMENFRPLGEDFILRTGLRRDVLRVTKVFFRAPSGLLGRPTEQVLDMLEKQNRTLNVKEWRVLTTKTEPKGQSFVCVVDDVCLKAIKAADCKAHVGLWQVTLVIMAGGSHAKGPTGQSSTQ